MKYSIDWLTKTYESGAKLKYLYFWGHSRKSEGAVDKSCFSQWYESSFQVGNYTYRTAEHWMMAQKALLFNNHEIFYQIVNCDSPAEVKELGRKVIGFDEQVWNEKKYEIVVLGNIHKFNQNSACADYLLNTNERIIVEASPVDTIWGVGLTQDSEFIQSIYTWRGLNLLGFALMEVRDFLRLFGHFESLNNTLDPPWEKHPDVDSSDLFWRMGAGEDYLFRFNEYYNRLSNRDQQIYRLTYAAPFDWSGFYKEA